MVEPDFPDFETLSLHAGQQPDSDYGARAVPIYQTTSYLFRDTDHAAGLFNLERQGHIYSRISNPTVAVFEERVTALEGGVGAVATASGQAALWLAISTIAGAGDHIVCSRNVYGGTNNLLTQTLPRFGIAATMVDPRDTAATAAAIRPETKLVLGETLGNPGLEIMDMPAVAAAAHEAGVPLLIDNTFATPYLFRPFEWGADLVYHSATKFLGGHGVALGGVLVDGGRFDWEGSGRFPTMTEPYPSYHGLRFVEEFGPQAFITRARVEGLRDFGAAMSPTNAFYLLQGIETLPIRMERHVANARAVVAFLDRSRRGRLGRLPRTRLTSRPRTRRQAPPPRRRRHLQLRDQRGARGRTPLHRTPAHLLPPRQCRRRQVAGHPPRLDHTFDDDRRTARSRRHRRGPHPLVRRSRVARRPHRRPPPGVAGIAEELRWT